MYSGNRDSKFYQLIFNLFKRAKLKSGFIKLCLVPDHMQKFSNAFTSSTYDTKNNYEYYEQIGDSTVNKFIVNYMYNRFPQLRNCDGVNVVARLKIKYGSKGQLYQIAERLEFWNFISASDDERIKRKKNLLEDVFEAFFGCFEEVINETIHQINGTYYHGIGYDTSFTLLTSIFDELSISIKYEMLVDAKTRLKDLFDEQRHNLLQLRYEDNRSVDNNLFISKAYNGNYLIGTGMSNKKKEAQEKAAEEALYALSLKGFVKQVPVQYSNL